VKGFLLYARGEGTNDKGRKGYKMKSRVDPRIRHVRLASDILALIFTRQNNKLS
jgi:hypothetical protein